MSKPRLEEAFHECLDALLAGWPKSELLARYPQYAKELERLLTTAEFLADRAHRTVPDFRFESRARARFLALLSERRRRARPGFAPFDLRRWAGSFAAALAAIAILGTLSAIFLTDSGSPPSDVQVGLRPGVIAQADRALGQLEDALGSEAGDLIDPKLLEELEYATIQIAAAVENGQLDESTKKALEDLAERQLLVLGQIAGNHQLLPPDKTDDVENMLALNDKILGGLGISTPPTATVVVTPEPTEEPTEEPTPAPTEEATPTPTEEPAPTPTEEPVPTDTPTPAPTEQAAAVPAPLR